MFLNTHATRLENFWRCSLRLDNIRFICLKLVIQIVTNTTTKHQFIALLKEYFLQYLENILTINRLIIKKIVQ